MKLSCPNCGYALASLDDDVKTEQKEPFTHTLTGEAEYPVKHFTIDRVNSVEPEDAQQRGGGLTTLQIHEARLKREQGLSLARIRSELGLIVTINKLDRVTRKPYR